MSSVNFNNQDYSIKHNLQHKDNSGNPTNFSLSDNSIFMQSAKNNTLSHNQNPSALNGYSNFNTKSYGYPGYGSCPYPPQYQGTPYVNNDTVLVIDDFTNKEIDVDGDGTADISHGQAVSVYAGQDGKQVEEKDISDGDGGLDEEKINSYLQEIIDNPGSVKDVNMSFGAEFSIEDLRTIPGCEDLDASNFKEYSEEVKEFLNNPEEHLEKPDDMSEEDYQAELQSFKLQAQMIDKIEQISAQGVNINIAAGNNGKDNINLSSFAEGDNINIVGATNNLGDKEGYSASGANTYAQGTYNSVVTADGYDINGDGVTDVENDEVSGGDALVNQFAGKSTDLITFDEEDYTTFISELESSEGMSEDTIGKVFNLQLLNQSLDERIAKLEENLENNPDDTKTSEKLEKLQSFKSTIELKQKQGNLLGLCEDEEGNLTPEMFRSRNGQILYDPALTGDGDAIAEIAGTSFASPTDAGQYNPYQETTA